MVPCHVVRYSFHTKRSEIVLNHRAACHGRLLRIEVEAAATTGFVGWDLFPFLISPYLSHFCSLLSALLSQIPQTVFALDGSLTPSTSCVVMVIVVVVVIAIVIC